MSRLMATDKQMNEWKFGFEFEFGLSYDCVKYDLRRFLSSRSLPKPAVGGRWRGWSIGHDGSVFDGHIVCHDKHKDIELKSPVSRGLDAREYLAAGCALIRKMGKTGTCCGLHVHASHPNINSATVDLRTVLAMHNDLWAQRLWIDHRYDLIYGWGHLLEIYSRSQKSASSSCYALPLPRFDASICPASYRSGKGHRFEIRSPGGIGYEKRPMTTWNYLRHCVAVLHRAYDAHHGDKLDRIRMIDRRIKHIKRNLLHVIRLRNKCDQTPSHKSLRCPR